jgi:hypothetical protein
MTVSKRAPNVGCPKIYYSKMEVSNLGSSKWLRLKGLKLARQQWLVLWMIHSTECLNGARAKNSVREELARRSNINVAIQRIRYEWVSNLEKR